MNNSNFSLATAFAVLILLLTAWAASREGADEPSLDILGAEWGEPAEVGNGAIRTFARLTRSGKPVLVGVWFTADLLAGLPPEHSDGKWDVGEIPCCGHETVLHFPASVEATAFRWFMLNWNPHGHPPFDVYGGPHFDFHFYTMNEEKRYELEPGACDYAETPVTCETFDRGMKPLPDDQMPPDYHFVGAVEPGMGNHLLDFTAPEFNGEPFTHTWIWGTFDAEIIFFEPMITKAFLEEKNEEVCVPVKMPAALPEAGWYPTEYCIKYLGNQDAYTVTLESFEWF